MGLFARKRGRIKEKWKYDAKSNILSGPMVYDVDMDGRREIVFGTKDGRVMLMDENSKIEWIYDVKEEVSEVESYFQDAQSANSINSPPLIGDINDDGQNEVVFGTESGVVCCLDHKGMIMWKFHADDAVRSSVLLHDVDNDGLLEVIFGAMDGSIYVLSANGNLKQKYDVGSSIECTPELIPETSKLLFGCHDGTVRCLDIKSGEQLWSFSTDGKVVAKPVVSDLFGNGKNIILVGSADYTLYVLTESGELIWDYTTGGAILSEVSVADIDSDGNVEVVFGSCDNNVYALKNDGDKVWSYETYFWVVAPPIIDDIDGDGKLEVIIGSYDHSIYVLDSEGVYALDYVPGLGGVVHQSGHHSELMTREPGKVYAEKIWQYKTSGYVVGCAVDDKYKNIIVNVKEGTVTDLIHEE